MVYVKMVNGPKCSELDLQAICSSITLISQLITNQFFSD